MKLFSNVSRFPWFPGGSWVVTALGRYLCYFNFHGILHNNSCKIVTMINYMAALIAFSYCMICLLLYLKMKDSIICHDIEIKQAFSAEEYPHLLKVYSLPDSVGF